jgi:predicted alpha/beta-hydrolase family hydrolase
MKRSEISVKRSSDLQISTPAGAVPALVYPAVRGRAPGALILAHGAGAGQRSAFMVAFAKGIAALGIDVITFDFPYITQKRRIPDRGPVLENCYRAAIAAVRQEIESARHSLFIGGKSMGGRIATQVAATDRDATVRPKPARACDGLVLLGYPLHPPGRPAQLRAAHLPAIGRPMLFVQGARDAFGTPSELKPILAALSPRPVLHVVAGGDHSLKTSGRDPQVQAAIYDDVQRTIVEWMQSVIGSISAD